MSRLGNLTLRAKFNIIVIGLFLALLGANAADDARRQEALAIRGATDHAQMLARQLVQTREYLAEVTRDEPDHNPNLIPQVAASRIAERVSKESRFTLRQVSLRYRDPLNRPDPYETKKLTSFITAAPSEVFEVVSEPQGSVFRYLLPMRAEKACLRCHGNYDDAPAFVRERFPRGHPSYNYRLGEVIGAASVSIPMTELYKQIGLNIRNDLIISAIILLLILFALQKLITRQIIDPITMLSESIDTVARTGSFAERLPQRSNDEIGSLIGSFNDMMEELGRKTVQQQSSDERYRSFIEMANSAVITFLANGKIVIVNKKAERLLGRSRQALIGEAIFSFLKEEGTALKKVIERYQSSGKVGDPVVAKIQNAAGMVSDVEITLSASATDGVPLFTAILREHPHT